MSFWTAAVIIIAIWAIADLIKTRHRTRHGITVDRWGTERRDGPEGAELRSEMEELRERLEVLERIATHDRESKRLAAEIGELRDQQERQALPQHSTGQQPTGRGE